MDERILSKRQLSEMAALPSADVLLAETCSLLQSPARRTTELLSANQAALSRNLEQYLKDQEKKA